MKSHDGHFCAVPLPGPLQLQDLIPDFVGWLSAAELEHATALAEDFPSFDGVLLLDQASLDAAADDFGHIVHREPLAVLKAGISRRCSQTAPVRKTK
jgi:hypothetical protein